jgi:phosphatidylglycerol lysyltransferase
MAARPSPLLDSEPWLDAGDGPRPVTTDDECREVQDVVARWGRSPVSPFLCEPGHELLLLPGGAAAGYRRVGRWAVFPAEVAAPPGMECVALDGLLAWVAAHRLRPVFAAVADPEPFEARGLCVRPIADDARLDLRTFTLAGPRMASIRHSVTSARRAGLSTVPYSGAVAEGVERVSREWLAQKRGGEMGFTLGRFTPAAVTTTECRVAVDAAGGVAGFVTWRHYDGGRGRVLDLMRRGLDAPNPTMDLLIGESLLAFAAAGTDVASLAAVPHSHGAMGERVYPTNSLRRYKDKFAPTWVPLSMIVPSRARLPGALRAVARAYCPDGLTRALKRNA